MTVVLLTTVETLTKTLAWLPIYNSITHYMFILKFLFAYVINGFMTFCAHTMCFYHFHPPLPSPDPFLILMVSFLFTPSPTSTSLSLCIHYDDDDNVVRFIMFAYKVPRDYLLTSFSSSHC